MSTLSRFSMLKESLYERAKNLLATILNLFRERAFIYLLFLNLISNCTYFYTNRTLVPLLLMICLSCSLTFLEVLIFRSLSKARWLRASYLSGMGFFYTVLILTDYFCLLKFQSTFNQEKLDIVRETTLIETKEFLHTYLTPGLILGGLMGVILLHVVLFSLSSVIAKSKRRGWRYLLLSASITGLFIWGGVAVSYVKFHNGFSIPQYTSITRIAYAYHISKQRSDEIKQLYEVCKQIPVSQSFQDKPNIIILIGESYSIYHSGLFGYRHNTTPNLKRLEEEGNLIPFDNAISVGDFTHAAMKSVFSLDSLQVNFNKTPLFPTIYKNGRYQTLCYENQYFVGGVNFLSDSILSQLMFTNRNKKRFQYDEDLINTVKVSDVPSLYIIHLLGQHYIYTQRYPEKWNKFQPKEYDKKHWDERQRNLIAQYDNATLYNDFVVNSLINKFKDTNSILIYFSDHGEEVFEVRDYNGHGNAALSPDLRFQIRVPLMIWMSDIYKKNHKSIYDKAMANRHTPLTTDDISHTILSVGGMQTTWYRPQRDFLNSQYNRKKHRIVLNSIDYDAYRPAS